MTEEKKIKVKKGVLIGKFFHDFDDAVYYYNNLSTIERKMKCIVELHLDYIPRYLIVGNSQVEAFKIKK